MAESSKNLKQAIKQRAERDESAYRKPSRSRARTLPCPASGSDPEVARHHPIGFLPVTDGAGLIPVALLGLPGGRNVYLDEGGRWIGGYIPAFIRRYPFLFSDNGADKLTVCIDRDFPGFSESEGQALFETSGEPAPFTQNAINLLTEYQRQVALTQLLVKRLQEADVLQDSAAEVRLEDGRSSTINGMLTIDDAKFRAIPETTLKAWFDGGELGCIYAQRVSMGHLVDLVRKGLNAQPAAAAPAAPAV